MSTRRLTTPAALGLISGHASNFAGEKKSGRTIQDQGPQATGLSNR